MKLRRQIEQSGQHTGRGRAAVLFDVCHSLISHRRALLLSLICAVMVFTIAFTSVASADTTEIDSLKAQANELEAQIADLDRRLETSTEAYNQLVVQLNELNVTMITLRKQKDAAESDYRYRLRLYEERLCDLYKAGGRDEFLQMIFDATSMDDFIDRARLAAELADQDRRLMENLNRSADYLETVLADIDQTKSQELTLRQQMADEQEYIETTLATRRSTLESVGEEITAAIEAEARRKAEEQARLQRALAAVLSGYGGYSGVLPESENETLNQFVHTAAAYIGIPYVWGGDRPSTGMDCSGYTQFVYKQHGVTLPHYSGYQAVMGTPVEPADIQPGDLVAFGLPVHHVGIYVGQGLYLHAAGTGLDVRVGLLSSRTDISAIRRFELQPRYVDPVFY